MWGIGFLQTDIEKDRTEFPRAYMQFAVLFLECNEVMSYISYTILKINLNIYGREYTILKIESKILIFSKKYFSNY